MLETTEEAITNGQIRETGSIGFTRWRKTTQKAQHNMYAQTNTNNAKTWARLQTTVGKDELNIDFMRNKRNTKSLYINFEEKNAYIYKCFKSKKKLMLN